MLIKGFQKSTMVDFPGNIAAMIFVARCNMRCPYCYNEPLVNNSDELVELDFDKIFKYLEKMKNLIDGVVITGGEPTLYADLPEHIKKIKDLGLKVKLDTNGTNPKLLKQLIDDNLLDYVAMDIKASLSKYKEVTRMPINIENIKESISIIKNSNIDYEFRTTLLPSLISKEDIENIGELLKGAKKYFLQNFLPTDKMMDQSFVKSEIYGQESLDKFKTILEKTIDHVEIR